MLYALGRHQNAWIGFPTNEYIGTFRKATEENNSTLQDLFFVTDRPRLHLQQFGDFVLYKIRFIMGAHMGNLYITYFYSPQNGVIIICAFNAPGAMYYSTAAEWGNI